MQLIYSSGNEGKRQAWPGHTICRPAPLKLTVSMDQMFSILQEEMYHLPHQLIGGFMVVKQWQIKSVKVLHCYFYLN